MNQLMDPLWTFRDRVESGCVRFLSENLVWKIRIKNYLGNLKLYSRISNRNHINRDDKGVDNCDNYYDNDNDEDDDNDDDDDDDDDDDKNDDHDDDDDVDNGNEDYNNDHYGDDENDDGDDGDDDHEDDDDDDYA